MLTATNTIFLTLVVIGVAKPLVPDDMLLYWRRSESPKCVPFTVEEKNCNRCVCSADGTPYCTKMDCERLAQMRNRDDDYSG